MNVELVHWNPRKRRMRGPLGRLLPKQPPVNNFGDLLGPMIVRKILEQKGITDLEDRSNSHKKRLLTVGSILRMAGEGDVIWGTGVNGKSVEGKYSFESLDVRAVRGPLTRNFLTDRGINTPELYGDPGLLVGHLWPKETWSNYMSAQPVTLIPNLHDVSKYSGYPYFWHPCRPVEDTIARIATSSFVIGSSLHAIILAESFGIPARLLVSDHEPPFKYRDYYLGTGRNGYIPARSVDEALSMGGDSLPVDWSPADLLDAFPIDLWRS